MSVERYYTPSSLLKALTLRAVEPGVVVEPHELASLLSASAVGFYERPCPEVECSNCKLFVAMWESLLSDLPGVYRDVVLGSLGMGGVSRPAEVLSERR